MEIPQTSLAQGFSDCGLPSWPGRKRRAVGRERGNREGWWVLLVWWHWNHSCASPWALRHTWFFRHQCPLFLSCYWTFYNWIRKVAKLLIHPCRSEWQRRSQQEGTLKIRDPDYSIYRWKLWGSGRKILTQMFTNRDRSGSFWGPIWDNSVKSYLFAFDLEERWT